MKPIRVSDERDKTLQHLSGDAQTIREALDALLEASDGWAAVERLHVERAHGAAVPSLDRLEREREEMLVDMTVLDAELTRAERERDEAREALREVQEFLLYPGMVAGAAESERVRLVDEVTALLADREAT